MGPRRAKVPALEPLAAPQSEQEQKERQRLHVKRAYYKKMNEMQNQRDRVRQLEEEHARLVVRKRTARKPWVDTNVGANDSAFPTDTILPSHRNVIVVGGLQSMQDLYTEISEVKEQLLAQNEAMRIVIEEHGRFAQKLETWMEPEAPSVSDDGATSSAHIFRGVKLLKPVTIEVCQDFAQNAYEQMRRYRQSRGYLSSGVSVFGWRDKRLPDGDRVKFSLQKTFQRKSALELSWRGFEVLSSAEQLASLFSASTNCTVSALQVVDDDNKILFRLMTNPDGTLLAKTIVLVTRFAMPNGFVIFAQSMEVYSVIAAFAPTLSFPTHTPLTHVTARPFSYKVSLPHITRTYK